MYADVGGERPTIEERRCTVRASPARRQRSYLVSKDLHHWVDAPGVEDLAVIAERGHEAVSQGPNNPVAVGGDLPRRLG